MVTFSIRTDLVFVACIVYRCALCTEFSVQYSVFGYGCLFAYLLILRNIELQCCREELVL